MAGALLIPSGTKMNITYDVPVGQGKLLKADPSQKLLIKYSVGSEQISLPDMWTMRLKRV